MTSINPSETPEIADNAPLLLYVTAPDLRTAESLAEALVAKRLAACVNLFPGMRSVYVWEGAVERAEEIAMLVKTTRRQAPAARALIAEQHPYDTPAILAIPIDNEASFGPFTTWIAQETTDCSNN